MYKKLCIAMAAMVLTLSEANAFPAYEGNFTDHYDFNGIDTTQLIDEISCGLCHVRFSGGGRRNDYGNDFRKAVRNRSGFAGIEMMDSDGDGFLNLEEIYFGSAPGQSESAPAKRLEVLEMDTSFTVSSIQGCETLEVKSFGYKFGLNGQSASEELMTYNVAGTNSLELTKTGEAGVLLVKCVDSVGSFGL